MSQIFISYSRVDNAFVEGLISRIETAFPDLDIWHDRSPHGLIGGDRWWDEILKAVAASDVFVYVLSNESVQSLYCQAEFTEARRLQKRIITIQARDHTELTEELADIQWVDMKYGPNDPDALQLLTAAINRQLKRARKLRPLWKPATPKPRKEAPPTRPADAPAVETPPLKRPSAEDEALVIARRTLRWQIIGTALGFAAIIVTILLALPGLLNNPAPTEASQIATTPTITNAPPQTDPPDPLQMAMQTQTREAELTRAALPTATHTPTTDFQATIDAISTATRAYFQTADAVQEQQTFEAQSTLDAANMATLQAWETIDAQATADAGATLTAQPTLDPLQAAYTQAAAYDYRAGNAAWTPIERDFDGVPMVLVPAGCFMMGSDNGSDDEKLVHEQCFESPFWIDQTEVTQVDFERLGGVKANENRFDGDLRPVERITWFEARDFCARRGARLPTEAEWEFAARGPDALVYPWGNEWNENNAVWSGNSNGETAEVSSRPAGASWIGALNMSGNVWEWVSSLYEPYPYAAADGREEDTGNRTDVLRVLRGGSWSFGSFDLRAPNRNGFDPVDWLDLGGIRCARPLQ